MKTLIAYATKYGGTKMCAERIAQKMPGQTELLELTRDVSVDLSAYDTVIVGCSVYMGKPRKEAKAFCERYAGALLEKRLGIYLCCIQDLDKTVAQQLRIAFSQRLREHAVVLGALGGAVDYTKLNGVDAFIMRLIAGDLKKKTGNSMMSTISEERIDRFVALLTEKQAAK